MSSNIFLVICVVAFASCINGQDKQYFNTPNDSPSDLELSDILGQMNNAPSTYDGIQNLLAELNQVGDASYQDDENELAALEAELAGLSNVGSHEADTDLNSMELLEAEIQRLEGQQSDSSTEQLEHEVEGLATQGQSAELSDPATGSLNGDDDINDNSLEQMERDLANLLQQGKSSEVSDGDDGDNSLEQMELELAALLQEDQSGELSLGDVNDGGDSMEQREPEFEGLLQDDRSVEVHDVGSANADDQDDSLEALEQELLHLTNQESGEESTADDTDDNSLLQMEREYRELMNDDHSAEDHATAATYDDDNDDGSLEQLEAELKGLLATDTSSEKTDIGLNHDEQTSTQTEAAGLNDDATSANIDNDDADDDDDNNDDALSLAGLLNANAEVAQIENMIKQMQTPGANGDFDSFLQTLTQLEEGQNGIAHTQGSMASKSLSSHGINSGSAGSNAAAQTQQTYTQGQSGVGAGTNRKGSYGDNAANTLQVSLNGGSKTNQANSYSNNEQSNTQETHQYSSSSSSNSVSGSDQDNLLHQILNGFGEEIHI
ncbi:dentin sialophosphoprotein-like [Argopecten irradians]|uniref:dentin sialophosphoprotein-like n=1 Tax=Argopecten irradians TaxID=31199 RepID=UPI00371CA034